MFPQSELDNYKLQVELLQEKLQRSEISRQQLEHKLDKILQKRDEHDKILRSKSKHKYQQFLEEQQLRNERNKQLVQMLERIEHQTVAMNARSERLKMMKLQYEMYFAKLVHSQTRRCIQSSTIPMMTPMMGTTTTLPGPMMADPTVEGYNYTKVYEEPTLMGNSYQRYGDPVITDREQFNRPQRDHVSAKLMEMPVSDYALSSDRSDYMDIRKPPVSYHTQQPYETNMAVRTAEDRRPFNDSMAVRNVEDRRPFNDSMAVRNVDDRRPINDSMAVRNMEDRRPINDSMAVRNMEDRGPFNDSMAVSREHKFYTNAPEPRENHPHPAESSFLVKSKQFADLDMPSTFSSASAPLTFDRLPNMNMGSGNISKESFEVNRVPAGGKERREQQQLNDMLLRQQPTIESNSVTSTDGVVTDLASSSQLSLYQDSTNDNPQTNLQRHHEKPMQPEEIIPPLKPQVDMKTLPKQEVQVESQNIKAPEFKPNKIEPILAESTINSTPAPETTPPTAVSIEHIENSIYGEIVNSPEETQNVPQATKPTVSPALLENLVTQQNLVTANIEPEPVSADQTKEEPQQYVADANTPSYDITTPIENVEGSLDTQNYPQTYEYNTTASAEDGEKSAVEYTGYENTSNAVDGNQQQEQQQYDYSNYDPSQYSYPGYIYDETTGEYKPDPNATAEQYATDQQYAEGYEQQYQQQEGYDYNQAYDQQDPQTAAVDSAAYENYDVTQVEQPANTGTPQSESVPQQQEQQQQDQPAAETEASDVQSADVAETSGKNTSKPTSILATADKKDAQKNKKRVNFVDSSETDESSVDKGQVQALAAKPNAGNESDFDFSSSSEAAAKQA